MKLTQGKRSLLPSNVFAWEAKTWSSYMAHMLESYPDEIIDKDITPISLIMITNEALEEMQYGNRLSDLLEVGPDALLIDYGLFNHAMCRPAVLKLRHGDEIALESGIHRKAGNEDERLFKNDKLMIDSWEISDTLRYRTKVGYVAGINLRTSIVGWTGEQDPQCTYTRLPSYMYILTKPADLIPGVNDTESTLGRDVEYDPDGE